jgi:hypothetical protein
VRVGDVAAFGAARDGDGEGGSFLEARLALGRGMDFPLLAVAGAAGSRGEKIDGAA